MKRAKKAACLLLVLSLFAGVTALGSSVSSDYGWATISLPAGVSSINLYNAQRTTSAVVDIYWNGTSIKVYTYGNDWSYVDIGGKTGYLQTQYIKFSTNTGTSESSATYAYVRPPEYTDRITLFKTASEQAESLGAYFADTRVRIIQRSGMWSLVDIGGRQGYMLSQFLSNSASGASAEEAQTAGQNAVIAGTYMQVSLPSNMAAVDLYADADTGSAVLDTIAQGARVQYISQSGGFTYVQYGSLRGYIRSAYLINAITTSGTENNDLFVRSATVSLKDTSSTVTLRATASSSSGKLGTYRHGTDVLVLSTDGAWSRVDVNGTKGYIKTEFLSFGGGSAASAQAAATAGGSTAAAGSASGGTSTAMVGNMAAGKTLTLRQTASAQSDALGTYVVGTPVKVLSLGRDWCRVEVKGKTGFMSTSYLTFSGSGAVATGSSSSGSSSGGGASSDAPVNSGGTQPKGVGSIVGASAVLYESASASSAKLGAYNKGLTVSVISYGAKWCEVAVAGLRGFMQTSQLSVQ